MAHYTAFIILLMISYISMMLTIYKKFIYDILCIPCKIKW